MKKSEINGLLSKGMSSIYLKVTVEKKWRTQNSNFLSSKSSFPGQFLGSSNSCGYHWLLKLLVENLKIRGLVAKLCLAFLLFLFWKELWSFNVKESMLFVNKNIKFNKNETKTKIENPTHSFRKMSHVFQFV